MWIILVLAGLAAIFVLALCLPLDTIFQVEARGRPRFHMKVSWLLGLVRTEIEHKEEKPREKPTEAPSHKKRKRADIRVIFNIARTRGLFGHIKDLVKDVLSCFRFRDLEADFKIGLGDPADTALLFAVLGPATVFFGASPRHRVKLEPSFSDDAVLQGYAQGTVRLFPIRLFPVFLKFIFSPVSFRVVRTLAANRWKKKK